MNERRRFDHNSINFRIWAYFTLFAVVIVILIWVLQAWFLNNRYESMKQVETSAIAGKIRMAFQAENGSAQELRETIRNESKNNDLNIFIRDENGFPVMDMNGNLIDDTYYYRGRFEGEIQNLMDELAGSELGSVTRIVGSRGEQRTLEFATHMTRDDMTLLMFIFAPLYPVKSTISILRVQLIYITIIALMLAFMIAAYISYRISRPIENITKAAAEMAKGDYSVKFHGGNYTEIKNLAATLSLAESEMQKTGEYQRDLISNVSHDLRTPLTMIKSYAEMIRDISGNDPVKRETHLNVIIDEADRLNVLVNDMLNLSRMQSKRMVIFAAPFDLLEATENVLSSYNILSEQEGYDIEFTSSKGPLPVNADEAKIKQVINNLMTNAVKYCGEDKKIIVSLKKSGRKVRFSVTDHGMGIAPDEVPHIWDKYYKSSTHHVRETEGTGLGLSIVKEILNLHRAEFDVKTAVGKGSTFWFELPLVKMPRNTGRPQVQPNAAPQDPQVSQSPQDPAKL